MPFGKDNVGEAYALVGHDDGRIQQLEAYMDSQRFQMKPLGPLCNSRTLALLLNELLALKLAGDTDNPDRCCKSFPDKPSAEAD